MTVPHDFYAHPSPPNCRCVVNPNLTGMPADLEAALRALTARCQVDIGCPHTSSPCPARADWILTLVCGCDTDQLLAACTPHRDMLPRLLARIAAVCDACLQQAQVAGCEAIT